MRSVLFVLVFALVSPVGAGSTAVHVQAQATSAAVDVAVPYASYLGTADCGLLARALTVDASGSTYVTGSVTGACFPMTPDAFQTNARRSMTNGFVAKLNPDGASVAWASYVAGNATTTCSGIGVDREGNVYVSGTTFATDLPIRGGFQNAASESSFGEGFLIKLDRTGSNLRFSSYLGGGAADETRALAVSGDGIVTVVGGTTSPDFPTTENAFLRTFPGSSDIGFVTVIDTTQSGGASLRYSTYFGGSHPGATFFANAVVDVALDGAGVSYLCGATNASDFPVTPGAIRTTPPPPGGARAGFVAVLDPSRPGSAGLRYATFVGGSEQDRCTAVAVDAAGAAYVAGVAMSADFPVTDGAFQTLRRGTSDAFVWKLDLTEPAATVLEYSTLVGGSSGDDATTLEVDTEGRAVLGGDTSSRDFPTRGSVMEPFDGYETVFAATVVRLEPKGTGLDFSTLFGGGRQDSVAALAVDAAGCAHAAVSSASDRLPTTPGALQAVAPAGPTLPVSAIVRFAPSRSVVRIEQPDAVAELASAVRDDEVGAVVSFPAPNLVGDDRERATVVFDPPSGSFFGLGETDVLAYVLVDGSITSATRFRLTVTIAFDTCVSATPGVRFRIVSDPQSPIYGAWQFVVDGNDDVAFLGIADFVREIPGKAIVYSDPAMKARYRLASGTWKVKVRVRSAGSEVPVTYLIIAPAGTCPDT